MELPVCGKCGFVTVMSDGRRVVSGYQMVPLSDYGEGGTPVDYKAWACVSEKCQHVIRIDKGHVTYMKERPARDDDEGGWERGASRQRR